MVLGEVLPMIHLEIIVVATMVTIAELKTLTSLEELSTHIQDPILAYSKLKWAWAMYSISPTFPMSAVTCANPHICTQE